jgi:hypothetical protein
MNQKIPNKYYWFGVLTIVPLFGFVIGILLLRKAIILKNHVLMFIGILGIVFTIAFYAAVLLYAKYSDFGKRKRSELAQMSINRVVKDIEFYKTEIGSYPDSLEQLKTVDNMVFIMDPLSQKGLFSSELQYLHYIKIDSSHYTIFSAGIDQIPNTADDVYPSLVNLQKTGLMKK